VRVFALRATGVTDATGRSTSVKGVRPRALFWGWYVALGGAASNFLVIGVATFGFGVFVTPMREELGWSVAAISAGVSLRSFEQGLLAPVTGLLVDRLGPRRMALFGLLTLVTGLLLFSQARSLPMFYSASLVIALGQSLASFPPFSARLMAWFVRKRGRAMGVLNTGNGAGYLAAPLLALLLGVLGWRSTLLIAAVVILAIGLPLTALLRDLPEDRGLLPDGERLVEGAAPARRAAQSGMTARDALRTPAFYLLVLANASTGSIGAWIVLQVPHFENVGFSLETAALLSGLYGVVQLGLRVSIGWLGDVFGRRRMYIFSFVLQGIGMVCFAQLTADRLWLLPLYYLTFTVGQAGWVVLGQTMVADYFGVARFATLRGFASTLQTPVGVALPVLAGVTFDRTGSYATIFTIYGVLAATGAIWVLLIRRPLWATLEQQRVERQPALAAGPDRSS